MLYYHAKGEPMSLADIDHMIKHLNFPNQPNPCAYYKQVMQQRREYLIKWGNKQLEIDSSIAQQNTKRK